MEEKQKAIRLSEEEIRYLIGSVDVMIQNLDKKKSDKKLELEKDPKNSLVKGHYKNYKKTISNLKKLQERLIIVKSL